MATNWPTSRDTFTNPSSGDTLDSPSHAAQHANINDAVEAMQLHAGLVLTATASGSNTVQIDNCFSSTFDNYRVTVTVTSASGDSDIIAQFCASGTAATGANYSTATWGFVWGSSFSSSASTGNTSLTVGRIAGLGLGGFAFDVYQPANARYTFTASSYTDQVVARHSQGRHALSTAYDGIKLMASGAATFTVRVYGYNNG